MITTLQSPVVEYIKPQNTESACTTREKETDRDTFFLKNITFIKIYFETPYFIEIFVFIKKRPTEAHFRAYKKRVLQKILKCKAGYGT